ncbi:phosphatase inhibitor-domain-containing protein [Cerioporus squamosus]|nr:phosphatase inhibitor-domain-containing protein [Cerioporus squamosus]
MATRQAHRPASDGSRTITVQDNQPREEAQTDEPTTVGALRLRGVARHRQRVVWREDVVDNEGAGKKKSKICCIYHRPKQFDESSSSDESSDSDSDSHSDDGRARRRCNHDHDHDHDGNDRGDHATASRDPQDGGAVHELDSDSDDVNAYERMPRRKPKKTKKVPHTNDS